MNVSAWRRSSAAIIGGLEETLSRIRGQRPRSGVTKSGALRIEGGRTSRPERSVARREELSDYEHLRPDQSQFVSQPLIDFRRERS
jgi:hypothetical protein